MADSKIVGIPLSTFTENLFTVPEEFNAKPRETFDVCERLGPHAMAYARSRFGERVKIEEHLHHLPLKAFARLSFDEVCKISYSTIFMMDQTIEDKYKNDPQWRLYYKIKNSMWRCGYGRDVWNDVVAAYDGVRNFSLPLSDDFEVRLDWTPSVNERAWAEYSETYLDGIFAYLIYYRGKHVMTLGFSIMSGKRLLIRQVQLREAKGNRWLFKLPKNYLEFFLDAFQQSFSDHTLYLVDGEAVVGYSLRGYESALEEAREHVEKAQARLGRNPAIADAEDEHDTIRRYTESQDKLLAKIAHIKADMPRLAAFYRSTGKFELGEELTATGMKHYLLAA